MQKYNKKAIYEYDKVHAITLSLLADKTRITKELVKSAVIKEINECIEENILRNFFRENRKEIIEMGVHEYSFERHFPCFR